MNSSALAIVAAGAVVQERQGIADRLAECRSCQCPTSTAYRMPHSDPPAISPELNSVPAPTSDSSAAPVWRLDEPAHQAAGEDRRGRRDRQVRADGERQRVDAAQLERHRDEDADEHQAPRQVLAQQALDDRRHQRRLRRRQPPASRSPNTLCRYSVVKPMTNGRGDDADDQADLLVDRRRADDVAGLQILRRVAGVRGRDADDGADAERDRARSASPVQPSATKIRQVRISVAIVMPEIGFDEDADQAGDARRHGRRRRSRRR